MLTIRRISVAVVVIFVCFLEGARVSGEELWKVEDGYSDVLYQFRHRGTSINEFSDRYICGSNQGQFYRIMKKHFCKMNSMLIYRFFLKLCQDHRANRRRETPSVLDFLVSNFFDVDNNGKISHYEKLAFQQFGA